MLQGLLGIAVSAECCLLCPLPAEDFNRQFLGQMAQLNQLLGEVKDLLRQQVRCGMTPAARLQAGNTWSTGEVGPKQPRPPGSAGRAGRWDHP